MFFFFIYNFIIINDPNGVVTATNSRSDSAITVKITSTGRAGLVSFRFPAEFELLIIWNNNEVVNGYPALKGFRSFGRTLRDVFINLPYSFEIPVNIPSTLKSVIFGFVNEAGSVAFNDPKISNWDVSNLEARSFDYMFAYCTNFNQDLSGWCVRQVTSPPRFFSIGSALTPSNRRNIKRHGT
jgi:surface protein